MAAMEQGDGVADKICALMADCGDVDACYTLDSTDVPKGCIDACMASPGSCSGLPGGCEAACHGLSVAVPDLSEKLECVMAAIGPSCDFALLADCFPSP